MKLKLALFMMCLCACSIAEARGRRGNHGTSRSSASQTAMVDKSPVYTVEMQLLEAVNAERRRFGLTELILDPLLHLRARRHCGWMANASSMVHSVDPGAENIAKGQPTVHAVTVAWMNSSGHRANILNPHHTKIGLAGYISPNGTIYWCQQFE